MYYLIARRITSTDTRDRALSDVIGRTSYHGFGTAAICSRFPEHSPMVMVCTWLGCATYSASTRSSASRAASSGSRRSRAQPLCLEAARTGTPPAARCGVQRTRPLPGRRQRLLPPACRTPLSQRRVRSADAVARRIDDPRSWQPANAAGRRSPPAGGVA
jgi:hypothetical protein